MNNKLYRKEAIEYKKASLERESLVARWLTRPVNRLIVGIISHCAYLRIDIFASLPSVSMLKAKSLPLPHSINVFAPQQGFIVKQFVKIGDVVKTNRYTRLMFPAAPPVAMLARHR